MFFLVSNWNFTYYSLCTLPSVLSLGAPPRNIYQSSLYSDERANVPKRHSRNFILKKKSVKLEQAGQQKTVKNDSQKESRKQFK